MKSLVIVPTYNEIENIESLIKAVFENVPSNVELLICDDGSPDGTGELVKKLKLSNPRIHSLHRTGKLGLGSAYVAGFKYGLANGFDAVIEMDADFSHNPIYLKTMLAHLEKNDFVIGSRYVSGGGTVNWGLGRKILSRGGSFYSRMILGAPIRDFTGGFNGWRKHVLENIALDTITSDGYSFQIELKYRAFLKNYRYTEFPIIFEDRKVGNSKMSKRIVLEALKKVWQFRASSKAAMNITVKAMVAAFVLATGTAQAKFHSTPTAILVDKKTNTLHVSEIKDGVYHVVKTFHTTVGKVKGDKVDEGDLKTPEGIFTFRDKLLPPSIAPKFGVMAFYINYPNDYDKIAGRTGNNIMLHATNEPARLDKNFDSEGCVVLKNEEIKEVAPFIKPGLTSILIFEELTKDYLEPGKDPMLTEFFKSWVATWSEKSIDPYMDHYHSDFSSAGKNKQQWKDYKSVLAKKYKKITITADDVLYYRHPKYSVITFTQDYQSTLQNGAPGLKSVGTKILYIAEEEGKLKIISENFTNQRW